jgi:hypothetical protein
MPDGYTYPRKHHPRPRVSTHIELVRSISDRDRDRLNDWERRFLVEGHGLTAADVDGEGSRS